MASRGLERRLLRAAAAGETEAVENLLRDGADPGCQVRTFNSHLHLVYFFSNKKNPTCCLPSSRIEQDRKGVTPLMFACERGNVDIVRSLLAAGAPW